MGLFSRKSKTSKAAPAARTRRAPEPPPTRANNWNRKHAIGQTVTLTDGRRMRIGGYDHDWYSGWIKGESGLNWVKGERIRGRK